MAAREVRKPDVKGLRRREPQPWFPQDTTFKVCPKHKKQFFKDYEDALVGTDEDCIICHPPESDALGG
jgi:hypothetical protein